MLVKAGITLTHCRLQNHTRLALAEQSKRLTLFEDFNEDLYATFPEEGQLTRIVDESIGRTLVKASLCLENLSVSFLSDAKDFFQAYEPSWIWKDLVSLALTSQLLNSAEDPADINNMLHAAGVVALNMPRLRIMEIWNGGRGHACVFRYRITDGSPTVTWDSVWDLRLESRVIKAWEAVALEYSGQTLRVDVHQIPRERDTIQPHTIAIDLLKLKQQILRPVSLYQIRKEEKKTHRP